MHQVSILRPGNQRRPQSSSILAGEQREDHVFGGGGAVARGLLKGGVAAMGRIIGLPAVENLLDGENLQARVGAAVGGFIESGLGGWR